MTTQLLPRLNKYGLAAPCADDVRSAVAAVDYLNFTKNWHDICDRADLSYHANLLTARQMHALSKSLVETGGSIGLIGQGFEIRISNYEVLSKQDDDVNRSIDLSRKTFEDLIRTRVPEPETLAEIDSLEILSPNAKMMLDDASRRIASSMHTPVGLITVALNSSQFLAGNHGLSDFEEQCGTPAEWAFCATTVRRANPYIVEDADADVIQRQNPLVRFHNIKSYIGVPLRSSTGLIIGAACALDVKPREFSEEDVMRLEQTAATIVNDLEESRDNRSRIRARI